MKQTRPAISVIVPARNEARRLPGTLEAIRMQTEKNYEIIVVANGCIDRTAELAERFGRVIRVARPGVARARNLGAAASSAPLLLFLDADIELPPLALAAVRRQFEPRFSVGTFAARPDSAVRWHRAVLALRNLAHRTSLYRSSLGTIVCRRETFLEVGGFDESLHLRENRDLIKKLSSRGAFCYLTPPVTVSMRRYHHWGLFRLARFWTSALVRCSLDPASKPPYELIP